MQGHIEQRGKDSWRIIVELTPDPLTGKRRKLRRTIRGTKKQAEALVAQLVHEENTGMSHPTAKTTVSQHLATWLRDYAKPNVRPSTYVQYESLLRRLAVPAIGSIELTELRPLHIQAMYAAARQNGRADGLGGLSTSTVHSLHKVLKQALQHAVDWQLLVRNPANPVKPGRLERRTVEPFDVLAVRRLLSIAERSRYGALVDLAIRTGMRRGELLGLRWSDFDEQAGVLYISQALQRITGQGLQFTPPKTGHSRRAVELSPVSVERLLIHKQDQVDEHRLAGAAYGDNGLIFATSIGTPIDPANLRHAWLKITAETGIPGLRFHDLRHASATFMLKQGTHPRIVMERLGHSSIRVTMDIYSHVLPGMQSHAARMLDTMLDGGELPLALPEARTHDS